jgi:hypothetical protein
VSDRVDTAEYIGAAARELAKQARAVRLTALGMLLEKAAMVASAEAIAAQWPKDAAPS